MVVTYQPASIAVTQRHAGKPTIAAHATKLVPVANGVLTAIQDLDQLKIDQVRLIAKSHEQSAALNDALLVWSAPLARDIEGFDPGAFTRDANLTFDVLQKAISLKRVVEQQGVDLPYRDLLLTALTARIDGMIGADESAQAARIAMQEKQRAIRELIGQFHKELVSFRRTVRATLGSSHFDYQRLRMPSRTAAEPPDGTTPETEPSETETERKSNA